MYGYCSSIVKISSCLFRPISGSEYSIIAAGFLKYIYGPLTRKTIIKKPPERRVGDTSLTKCQVVKVRGSFPRRYATQIKRSLGCDKPLCPSQPRVPSQCHIAITPRQLGNKFNDIVSVTDLRSAQPPVAVLVRRRSIVDIGNLHNIAVGVKGPSSINIHDSIAST